MYAIGEAAADINAARQELLANVDRIYDIVDAGKEVSFEDRAAGRRTQVRAVWRAVSAVDQIFARSGGNALRMDKPLQRYWRDAHAGLAHAIHVPGTAYHASALSSLGVDPAGSAAGADLDAPMSDQEPRLHHRCGQRHRPLASVRLRCPGIRRGQRVPTRRRCTCGWTSARHASSWSPATPTGSSPSAGRYATTPRWNEVKATLDAAGVPFKELSAAEADARRVEEVITFEDPAGTTLEVFHGAVLDHSPVVTPFGARFVTGDQGLGHVVLPATRSQRPVRLLHRCTGFPVPRRIPGARAAGVRPDAGPVPRHQRAPPQPGDLSRP